MAKANKKTEIKLEPNKSAEESSSAFHNIIKASVANNPKPIKKK